jgi:hypothetical protein
MINGNSPDEEYYSFVMRNKHIFERGDFQAAISRKISELIEPSIILFLKDLGFSTEDAFYFVDSLRRPVFKLWKVPLYPGFLRVYLYQAMTAGFGLSDDLRHEYCKLNKKMDSLSVEEVKSLLIDSNLLPDDDSDMYFYYFFNQPFTRRDLLGLNDYDDTREENTELAKYVKSFANKNYDFILSSYGSVDDDKDENEDEKYPFHYGQFPPLFTNIMSVSFEQGGMLILELFKSQIYELYTANGQFIEGPCHDLALLSNAKYIARSSGNSPGFHMYQFLHKEIKWTGKECEFQDSETRYIQGFGDLDSAAFEQLDINGRDKLNIETGSCLNIRIENFKKPISPEETLVILQDEKTNYITSPELSLFYQNHKESALQAVKRNALAFTLLHPSLQKDPDVIRCLCLESQGCLDDYFTEYTINPQGLLTDNEVRTLIGNKRLGLHLLPKEYKNNRSMLLASASCDYNYRLKSLLEEADEIHRNDSEIILAALQNDPDIYEIASEGIRNSRDIALAAVKLNFRLLEKLNENFKNDPEIVKTAIENGSTYFKYFGNKTIEELAHRYSPLLLQQEFRDLINKAIQQNSKTNIPF